MADVSPIGFQRWLSPGREKLVVTGPVERVEVFVLSSKGDGQRALVRVEAFPQQIPIRIEVVSNRHPQSDPSVSVVDVPKN